MNDPSDNEQGNDGNFQALVYRDTRDLRNLDSLRQHLVDLIFHPRVRRTPRRAFATFEKLQHVSFPEGLQYIEPHTFMACSSLKTISFPSSLLRISQGAFTQCGLESVEFNEGLQTIEDDAFLRCEELQTIELPQSLGSIGVRAFGWCSKLNSVNFGMGVQTIDPGAFFRCVSLTVIHLPPSLERVPLLAFGECSRLLSVEFPPSGMRGIGENAFVLCNVLTNVVIPSSPTEVEESSFQRCARLSEVFFPDIATLPWNAFYHAIRRRYIKFPVHEFCYKQPYKPMDTALEDFRRILSSEPDAIQQSDAAGMTAFHVLALSSRPEMNLFLMLQAYSPRWVMEVPDRWGFRPIQYMCMNSSIPIVERQRLVDYLADATVKHRAHKLKLPKWRLAVLSKAHESLIVEEGMSLEDCRQIANIYQVLERHELFESLSLLELRLWHWKLKNQYEEGPDEESSVSARQKRIKLDERELARVNCGADIVIGNVLSYLVSTP